jgi:hypothetical protein
MSIDDPSLLARHQAWISAQMSGRRLATTTSEPTMRHTEENRQFSYQGPGDSMEVSFNGNTGHGAQDPVAAPTTIDPLHRRAAAFPTYTQDRLSPNHELGRPRVAEFRDETHPEPVSHFDNLTLEHFLYAAGHQGTHVIADDYARGEFNRVVTNTSRNPNDANIMGGLVLQNLKDSTTPGIIAAKEIIRRHINRLLTDTLHG